MAARLPPELAGELYCRANVDPMQYATMNPQTAIELLDRAWLLYTQNQLSFGFNYIDKPPGIKKSRSTGTLSASRSTKTWDHFTWEKKVMTTNLVFDSDFEI